MMHFCFLNLKCIEILPFHKFKPENRSLYVNALAFEIHNRYLEIQAKGYEGDYYSYARAKDYLGKKISSSCKEKNGSLHQAGITLVDLLREAQLLNKEIKFRVRKKNQFKITPDIGDRIARIIAKRILPGYKSKIRKITFNQYFRSHWLGKKISKSTSNREGQLKKLGITVAELMDKASRLEPELKVLAEEARRNSGLKSWATIRQKLPDWTKESAIQTIATTVHENHEKYKTNTKTPKPFYTFSFKIDPLGKSISDSCTKKEGALFKLGLAFEDIVEGAKKINPLISSEKTVLKIETKEQAVEIMLNEVHPAFEEAQQKGYMGNLYRFATKIHPRGRKIAHACNDEGRTLHSKGITVVDILEAAKIINPKIEYRVGAKKQNGEQTKLLSKNLPQTKQRLILKEKKRENHIKKTAPVQIIPLKPTLFKKLSPEDQEIKAEIKKLWPDYLELRKKMMIGTPFPEYAVTILSDLAEKTPHFMKLLNESFKELTDSHGSKQSTEALQKVIMAMGQWTEPQ